MGLNKTTDQLVMVNRVHQYGHVLRREGGHVLRREGGHVLRRALDLEVEGQRKKWMSKEKMEAKEDIE